MTDEELKDRVEIQNLFATAAQTGDVRKAEDYANCFTEDGVLEIDRLIEGRDAIRAFMSGRSIVTKPPEGPPTFISHNLTTSRVEFTGAGAAKARTYWLVMSAAGLDHSGYYDDRLRKVEGRWLIAHRRPRTLWFSRDSVVRQGGSD